MEKSARSYIQRPTTRMLIINPSSSEAATGAIVAAIDGMQLGHSLELSAYTTPQPSPAIITNQDELKASQDAVYTKILNRDINLDKYDSVLIANFGAQSLVSRLFSLSHKPIMGICEASFQTAQSLLCPASDDAWGVVTIGKFWEAKLSTQVRTYLGIDGDSTSRSFAGVFSAGSEELRCRALSQDEIERRIGEATRRLLLSAPVRCVVLGYMGMFGLEGVVRSIAADVSGKSTGEALYIIDPIKAGVLQLQQTAHSRLVFSC